MRCPRCNKGSAFAGYLRVADLCTSCGLDIRALDAGDGPAIVIVFVVGAVVGALALWTELHLAPPLWLHMILWLPLVVVLTLALLRPFKGVVLALTYAHQAGEGREGPPQ